MASAHWQHCPTCCGSRIGTLRRYRGGDGRYTGAVWVCGACTAEHPIARGLCCRRCGGGRLRVYKVVPLVACVVRKKRCRKCGFRDRTVEQFSVLI